MKTMTLNELSQNANYKNKNGICINDDAIEIMSSLSENSIDLIITDPPYKTITGGDSNGVNSIRPKGMLNGNRKLFKYQTNLKIKDWMSLCYKILKMNSHAYFFTNSLNLKEMLIEAEAVGFKLHNILVWEKNNCTPSQYYMKNCEYILFMRKGKAKWVNDIGGSKTVHKFNNIIGKKTHPCEKPVDLLEFYINNSSNINDIVFDPFMGSGATCVASQKLNRRFVGIELDKKYFDIATERLGNENQDEDYQD